jgi:hypothetical protein
MPTVEHDALAELFRFQPALAVALLRDILGLSLPEYASFELPETDFTQTMATEYRADGVVLLQDLEGEPVLGVVVEIQRAIDERKRWSWPVYAGALRARWRCPVALLVLCLDDETAAWARQPIDLGFGQLVQPFAVGPGALPRIRDAEQARRLPELAVLSAMTHGNDEPDGLETVLAAMVALARFDDERARFYLDLILARLNERVSRALEAMRMQKYEYQSEFARKYYGQGKQEGFAEGLNLGEARGKAEGKAEGEARAVLAVLEARGIEVPTKVREVVLSCTDLTQLDAWVRAAVTIPGAEALLTSTTPSPASKKARRGRRMTLWFLHRSPRSDASTISTHSASSVLRSGEWGSFDFL